MRATRGNTGTAFTASLDAVSVQVTYTTPGTTTLTTNANGNLVGKGADTFAYDQANHLTSATVAGTTETYAYDGDGVRTSRTVGASPPISYVSDVNTSLPVALEDGARKYVWGVGLAYAVSGSSIEVYHTDRLGTVRAITDGSGAVTATYPTDEYGVPTASTGSSGQPFGYTGEPRDATGLSYLRARYYDPSLGRFLSRDAWAGTGTWPGSLNRYAYVANNPIAGSDPSGQCPWCVLTAAVGAAVSTTIYLATTEDATLSGALGAAAGGAVLGALAGVAGPLAATAVAQLGVGGVGGALLEGTLAAGINFGAGALGTVAQSYVSTGGPPSARQYFLGGFAGVATAGLANILYPPRGVTYMSQLRWAPHTIRGAFNVTGKNTRATWTDGIVGSMADVYLSGANRRAPAMDPAAFYAPITIKSNVLR